MTISHFDDKDMLGELKNQEKNSGLDCFTTFAMTQLRTGDCQLPTEDYFTTASSRIR